MKLLKDFTSGKAKDGAKAQKFHVVGDKLVYRNVITENVPYLDRNKAKRLLAAHEYGLVTVCDPGDVERLKNALSEKREHFYGIRDVSYRTLREETLAIRLANGTVIGNSARLQLLGRKVAFGRVISRTGEQHEIQRKLAESAIMVPFSVFEAAGLDVVTFQIVDQTGAETVKRKVSDGFDCKTKKQKFRIESIHFTGASLFKVSGKLYLFDIDRIEIKHGIFNPFLVEIPDSKIKTVADAYVALKPDEVKQAEAKGLEVKRQGEWFFIPAGNSKLLDAAHTKAQSGMNDWQRKRGFYLRVGRNRPNHTQAGIEVNKKFYVKGKVSHTGREHKDQKLNGWHLAIPNTANASFQIRGDVD